MKLKISSNKKKILIHMLIMVILLRYYWIDAQSCTTGYLSQDGVCTQWAASWYTCTNAIQWDSWYNKFLNKTTMLCEFWPYGQFYSSQVGKWSSWEGNWKDEWGYQSECYVWPTGMMFDLTLLKWVNNCASSQLFIQDPSMRNIPLCRDTVYYIDTGSLQPIELGTK